MAGCARGPGAGWAGLLPDSSGSGSCWDVCQKCVEPAVWGLLVLREKEVSEVQHC